MKTGKNRSAGRCGGCQAQTDPAQVKDLTMKQKMIGAAAVLLAALALAGGSGQLAALDDFPAAAAITALGTQSDTDNAAPLTAQTAGETPDFTKKVMITGAAGFIGYHLARRLLKEGFSVFGVDNLNDYYDVRLKELRLSELEKY